MWFIDKNQYLQWAEVIAFTETHIIVNTARSEWRNSKEKFPMSGYRRIFVKASSREEAITQFSQLGIKNVK